MSDTSVDFKLTLNDKEFAASVKNAGKLLKQLSADSGGSSKKLTQLDATVNSLTRNVKLFSISVTKASQSMEDFAAGAELLATSLRNIRSDLASINRSFTVFNKRVDESGEKVRTLSTHLKNAQGEMSDFSDYAEMAGRSTKEFSNRLGELNTTTSSSNRRLNNTTKALLGWDGATDKASAGVKDIVTQLDALINRQKMLGDAPNPRDYTPRRGSSGGSGSDGGSGRSGGHGGAFDGLRGAIFTLGEVGDAARTVKEMLFGWQEPIVEAAAEMQKMQVLLQGLNKGSADPVQAAAKDMALIVETSRNAPFAIAQLTDSFVKFKSAGIDPADGSWKSLIDSVARFGGDSELLNRAAVAIQQMSGKGVISMEELRQQLGEAVPTAMQAMADAAGVSMADLVKQISTGTVSAKEGLRLLFVGLEAQNAGAAQSMMNTYTGALAQMQSSFTLFSDSVGKSGYLDAMSRSFKEIATVMNSADGQQFSRDLGQGLATVITQLSSMARWLIDNRSLVASLGEIALSVFAFKKAISGFNLLKSTGVASCTQIANAFKLINTAGMSIVGVVARIISDIRNFGATAAVLIRVGDMIRAMRAAWLAFTAVIAANPVGVALAAIATAVGGIIYVMNSLKDTTKETLDEIRKIPQALDAAKRAQLSQKTDKLQQSYDENKALLDDQTLAKPDQTFYARDENGSYRSVDREGLKAIMQRQLDMMSDIKSVVGNSTRIQAKDRSDASSSDIARDTEGALASALEKYSNGVGKQSSEARLKLKSDKTLSSDQYTESMVKINDRDREANLKPYDEQISIVDEKLKKLAESLTLNTNILENPTINQDVVDSAKGNRDSIVEQIQKAQAQKDSLQQRRDVVAGSRVGTPGLDGSHAMTSVKGKGEAAARDVLIKNNASSGKFLNVDGTAMKDMAGNEIVGKAQLLANQRIQKAYGDNIKIEQLASDKQEIIREALTAAMAKDTTTREKLIDRQSKAQQAAADKAQRASEKQQRAAQKEADGYQKALDKSDQLIAKMDTGSSRIESYSQSVDKTTVSLEKLANATPSELISQEMIDKAKENLTQIQTLSAGYVKSMDRKQAKSELDSVAPDSSNIISSGLTDSMSRQDRVSDFSSRYDKSMEELIKTRDRWAQEAKSDSTLDVYVEEANKRILQLEKAGNAALIKEAGTASQKLALEYGDMASQIETVWADVFSGLTDTLTDFLTNGESSFKDFGRSILKEITNVVVKSQVVLPLMNMLGMGTGQTAMQQTGAGALNSAVANQGAALNAEATSTGTNVTGGLLSGITNLFSSPAASAATPGLGTNVNNGDGTLFGNAKQTTSSFNLLGNSTNEVNYGFNDMSNTVVGSTKSLQNMSAAAGNQVKSIASTIFSMQGLQSASGALMVLFSSMTASSNSKSGRWMGFAGTVASGLVSAYAGGAFGGGASAGASAGSSVGSASSAGSTGSTGAMGMPTDFHAFAKGGIMGPDGVIPLHKYAKGGIASTPQLALFGEGSHKEAYVPLPDGRSIPVTMTGDVGGAGAGVSAPVSININVQSDGSANTNTSGDASNWKDAAEKMKSIALDTIRQEKRPGGSLNANTNGNR